MLQEHEILEIIEDLTAEDLSDWVARGWVAPEQKSGIVHYREVDVARVQFIVEMRRDLQIDEGSLPVILSLVDQVYGLRSELHIVTEAIQTQPDNVQKHIIEYVQKARSKS